MPAEQRPLRLADRGMIESALDTGGMAPSEHCFANLYLFRDRHSYCLADDPVPHLRGVTYDGMHHALPLVSPDNSVLAALAGTGIDCIFPLDPELRQSLGASAWPWTFLDADSDYWYDGAAMAQMQFAKPRRAEALKFAAQFEPQFEPWSEQGEDAAVAVLEGWLDDVGRAVVATDVAECREAIRLHGELGLEGCLVRTAGGTPVAFLLASRRRNGTAVVHFAKGRREHSGAYPWMFAQFALWSQAPLLNFEQDLGNPGLAQSKRAYQPIERRTKWRLVAKRHLKQ